MAGSANLNVMIQAARKAARRLVRDFNEVENLQVSVKGVGRLRLERGSQGRGNDPDCADGGTSELRLSGRGRRGDPRQGSDAALDRRPAGRHHELSCTACRIGAVSIALEHKGEIVSAVVYDPAKDEMFTSEKGEGAWMNDRRLRVSARREPTPVPFRHRHTLWRASGHGRDDEGVRQDPACDIRYPALGHGIAWTWPIRLPDGLTDSGSVRSDPGTSRPACCWCARLAD